MNIVLSLIVAVIFALVGLIQWIILAELGVSTHRLGEGMWVMFYLPVFVGASAMIGLVGTLICFHISDNTKYSSGKFVILNSGKRFFLSSLAMFSGSLAGGLLWIYFCPKFLNPHSLDGEILYAILLAPATILGGSIGILLTYLLLNKIQKTIL